MLSLAGTLLVAVMLDRQTSQTLNLGRQISGARSFHLQRGMREIFQAWANEQTRLGGRQAPLRNSIELDGRIGDLTLPDGTRIVMYAFDAQGKIRLDGPGFSQQERDDVQALLDSVGTIPDNQRRAMTRELGPVPVSIFAAPVELLSDIVNHVTEGVHQTDVLDAILALRDDPRAQNTGLSKPEISQHLEDGQSELLQRVLTMSPRLWEVVLEAQLGREFAPVPTRVRFWGHFLTPDARAQTNMYASRIQVLGWEQVNLEGDIGRLSVEEWRRMRDEN
jgi:hypothetical protein